MLKTSKHPVLTIGRAALKADRLVYIIKSNKRQKYRFGRSRILYIGTTEVGAYRVAHSAVDKAYKFLRQYATKELQLYIVTCTRIPGVPTWEKLERALILQFRSIYGDVPRGNKTGMKMKWRDEREYFRTETLEKALMKFD